MKKRILTILLIFAGIVSQAQINLVLNPGFEDYSTCPDFIDETKYCNYWMSLDSAWSPPDWAHVPYGVPQYSNLCATNYAVSIPASTYYNRYPRTGNGMMYSVMYSNEYSADPNSREYLQGHLRSTLVSGKSYSVAFHVTSTQSALYAVNQIGVYLDDGSIDTTHSPGRPQISHTPQVVDTNIVNDTMNWIKIQGNFVAAGVEKIITIGNFSDKAHTNVYSAVSYPGLSEAVYLIDDVSVIDCSNIPHAGNDTIIFHPGDSVFLGVHEELLPYYWYVLGGTAPIDSGGGIWVKPTVTTTYIIKQVLCDRVTYDTVRVRVWPDTITNVAMAQVLNGSIYPSPTKGLLTVEGVKGCAGSVYDVLGREVLSGIVATENEVLDLEQLVKGVYMVVVTDRVTGFRVVRQVLKE